MNQLCKKLLYQVVAKAWNVQMKFCFKLQVLNLIYLSTWDKWQSWHAVFQTKHQILKALISESLMVSFTDKA